MVIMRSFSLLLLFTPLISAATHWELFQTFIRDHDYESYLECFIINIKNKIIIKYYFKRLGKLRQFKHLRNL